MTSLNKTVKATLDAAIRKDHKCTDTVGCDIEVARIHGFTLAAAYLLMNATETPNVSRVVGQYSIGIGDVYSPDFKEWIKFHHRYKRQCQACESFMYADPDACFEPETCTNCLSSMNNPEEQ